MVLVDLPGGKDASQALGRVGVVAPSPEPHNLVQPRFCPDLLKDLNLEGQHHQESGGRCQSGSQGMWVEYHFSPKPHKSLPDTP